MKALDTNILVRLLVADDAPQTQRVAALLKSAELAGESFFVSTLVLLELVWVLDSAYECTRAETLEALERLTMMPVLHIDNLDTIHHAISLGRQGSQDIADLLIACSAAANGCTSVVTFDQAAAKHDLFERL
jgi:predicted nucleic-acid-binding protein